MNIKCNKRDLIQSVDCDMQTLKQLDDALTELNLAYDIIEMEDSIEIDSTLFASLRDTNTIYKVPTISASDNLSTTLLMEHPVEVEASTQFAKEEYNIKKTCCVIM